MRKMTAPKRLNDTTPPNLPEQTDIDSRNRSALRMAAPPLHPRPTRASWTLTCRKV
jgi:hypothetical protein